MSLIIDQLVETLQELIFKIIYYSFLVTGFLRTQDNLNIFEFILNTQTDSEFFLVYKTVLFKPLTL